MKYFLEGWTLEAKPKRAEKRGWKRLPYFELNSYGSFRQFLRRKTAEEYTEKVVSQIRPNDKEIVLIGHSFGAMLSIETAYKLSQEKKIKVKAVICISAPWKGSKRFSDKLFLNILPAPKKLLDQEYEGVINSKIACLALKNIRLFNIIAGSDERVSPEEKLEMKNITIKNASHSGIFEEKEFKEQMKRIEKKLEK